MFYFKRFSLKIRTLDVMYYREEGILKTLLLIRFCEKDVFFHRMHSA